MSDEDNKIKVFASDDNLKSLGELLSNETSRKIIKNLMEHQMYTNEIATKLDIRVSLVIHHLKKLEELGLVQIVDRKIKRKGEKHRFFKIDSDIFVTINKTKNEVEEKGVLKRIFRDGIKFTSILLLGILSWFGTSTIQNNIGGYPPPNLYYQIPFPIIPTIVCVLSMTIFLFFIFKKKRDDDQSSTVHL